MRKSIIAIIPALFLAVSCEDGGYLPVEPPASSIAGQTVLLENEDGAEAEITVSADGNWTVVNNAAWFTVSPDNGFEGDNSLTVSALGTNEAIRERVDTFQVLDGASPKTVYVIQRGVDGFEVPDTEFAVSASQKSLAVTVYSSTEEFRAAVTDADWLSVDHIDYNTDSVLLADSATYSRCRTSSIVLTLTENTTGTSRMAAMDVAYGNRKVTVEVVQSYAVDAEIDWNRDFYRQSLFLKFTGSGCGYCPRMSRIYDNATEKIPGRMLECNVHAYGDDGILYYPDNSSLTEFYGVSGFPYVCFNSMVHVTTPSSGNESMIDRYGDLVVDLIEEAVEGYPSKTNIQASATLRGNSLTLDAVIAVKEQGRYYISAFILEDGIIADQKNYDGETLYDYEHNAVMRLAVTGQLGDELGMTGTESFLEYSKTITVPDGRIKDMENAYIIVWTSREGNSNIQEVPVFEYQNLGIIVDNVVILPMNGAVDFRYED